MEKKERERKQNKLNEKKKGKKEGRGNGEEWKGTDKKLRKLRKGGKQKQKMLNESKGN